MAQVYFDSSIFLAILGNEPSAPGIRQLLAELSSSRTGIHTSILTISECCVGTLRANGDPNKVLELIYDIAKVQSVTEAIAVATAGIEARLIELCPPEEKIPQMRRKRRWDCFHTATAADLNCSVIYALDDHFEKITKQCGLSIRCLEPKPQNPLLFS